LREKTYDNFLHDERYIKSPILVEKFISNLPIANIPKPYVVFKPLDYLDNRKEKPQAIIFLSIRIS